MRDPKANMEPFFNLIRQVIFWAVIAVICLMLLFTFIQVSGVNNNSSAGFEDMLTGKAAQPYVNRLLIPWVDRLVIACMPDALQRELRQQIDRNPALLSLVQQYRAPTNFALEAVISWILMGLCLAGFCWAFRMLISTVYVLRAVGLDLLCIIALLGLVIFFGFGYIYDFSSLFFFTLALAYLARQKWLSYSLTFVLALLNKETAVLLFFIFIPYAWMTLKRSRSTFFLLAGGQLSALLAIRWMLTRLYSGNPGALVEIHTYESGLILQAFPGLVILLMAVGILLAGLIAFRWNRKPILLRWSAVALPPLLILYLVFGLLTEIRVFYEAYPIVWGLTLGGFLRSQNG